MSAPKHHCTVVLLSVTAHPNTSAQSHPNNTAQLHQAHVPPSLSSSLSVVKVQHKATNQHRIDYGSVQGQQEWVLTTEVANGQVGYLDQGNRSELTQIEFEQLSNCQYIPHLLFAVERDLHGRHEWAFSPPVSPTMPFGRMPLSSTLGCSEQLRSGAIHRGNPTPSHVG